MAKKKTAKKVRRSSKPAQKVATPGDDFYQRMGKQARDTDRSGKRWRFPDGETRCRLVAFEHDGELHMFEEERMHWGISNGRGRVPCPGEGCPICSLGYELEDDERNATKWAKASRRYRCNLIVRGKGGAKDELKQVSLAASLYDRIKEYSNPDSESFVKDFVHPVKGWDIIAIYRKDATPQKMYDARVATKRSPVGKFEGSPVDLIDKAPEPASMQKLEEIAETIRQDL